MTRFCKNTKVFSSKNLQKRVELGSRRIVLLRIYLLTFYGSARMVNRSQPFAVKNKLLTSSSGKNSWGIRHVTKTRGGNRIGIEGRSTVVRSCRHRADRG